MPDYRRRAVDAELDSLLGGSAAVLIEGPRGVGKTTTALRRAATVHALDDPGERSIAVAAPNRLTAGPRPILIDEWQLMPESWDLVRRAVDADRSPGQFLLTGSASPRTPPLHSGAGRIVTLRMRPMSLHERGVEVPSVSLSGLIAGGAGPVGGTTDVRLETYAREILASGFPALRGLSERVARAELDGYLNLVLDRDIGDAGHQVRNRSSLLRWLRAYAASVSTTTSFEKIRAAASAGTGGSPGRATVGRYLEALDSTWLIDAIPGWKPARNDLSRLTLAPKHQLADPALAGRLRRATAAGLLGGVGAGPLAGRHATLFGALFESLVTLDVKIHAQTLEADVFHFRDRGGEREVDLIVEGLDGRVVAIEVKLAATVSDADVRHLLWLRDRIGDQMADAVVVTTGREAYRRRDGIAVVPAALLGP